MKHYEKDPKIRRNILKATKRWNMIGVLDCGSTNTKLYLINKGKIVSCTYKNVGLKDYSLSQDKSDLARQRSAPSSCRRLGKRISTKTS